MNKWDKYFMDIADAVAKRSPDIHSRFGCIAVSKNHSILSTGYNGPPRLVDDTKIPLTRPDKYIYMEHAERNCIYNAAKVGVSLENCTFYVNGFACLECLRGMYQVGANRIVMTTTKAHSFNENWQEFADFIQQYITIDYV